LRRNGRLGHGVSRDAELGWTVTLSILPRLRSYAQPVYSSGSGAYYGEQPSYGGQNVGYTSSSGHRSRHHHGPTGIKWRVRVPLYLNSDKPQRVSPSRWTSQPSAAIAWWPHSAFLWIRAEALQAQVERQLLGLFWSFPPKKICGCTFWRRGRQTWPSMSTTFKPIETAS
jgi:hypothetical protein